MATLRATIYQTLRDDDVATVGLNDLLGKTATPFGIYWMNPPENPDFPIITYFVNTQSGNFPRTITFNITAWTGNFVAILDRVFTLLHDKTIAVDDYGFVLIKYDWSSPDMLDENFRIHYRQDRYLVTGIRKI